MMCKVLVIMCLSGFLFGKIQSSHNKQDIETRIIGGISVPITHRPYIVSIHRRHSGFVCGGVIVGTQWILTALHCIPSPRLKAQYFVRAGSRFHDRGGTFHVFRHIKLFNSSTLSEFGTIVPIHDIALVDIFPKFEFSSRTLPARLPEQDEEPPDNLWVSGWGVTPLGVLSDYLQTVDVHRVQTKLCQSMSTMYASLMSDDKHICYGGHKKDSCHGDSGGPLGVARNVHGIVSFGVDCGKYPGVYVKLSYYSEWIHSIIDKDHEVEK